MKQSYMFVLFPNSVHRRCKGEVDSSVGVIRPIVEDPAVSAIALPVNLVALRWPSGAGKAGKGVRSGNVEAHGTGVVHGLHDGVVVVARGMVVGRPQVAVRDLENSGMPILVFIFVRVLDNITDGISGKRLRLGMIGKAISIDVSLCNGPDAR